MLFKNSVIISIQILSGIRVSLEKPIEGSTINALTPDKFNAEPVEHKKPESQPETHDSVGTKLNISFSIDAEMSRDKSRVKMDLGKNEGPFESHVTNLSDNTRKQIDQPQTLKSQETEKINTDSDGEPRKETASERRRQVFEFFEIKSSQLTDIFLNSHAGEWSL